MKTTGQKILIMVSLAVLIAAAKLPAAEQPQPAAPEEPALAPPPPEGAETDAPSGPWGHRGRRGPGGPAGGRGIGLILRGLDLSDEQAEQVRGILSADAERAKSAAKAVAEARKALHKTVMEGADEAAVRAAAAELAGAITENSVAKAAKMASVRKLLTEEQLAKLDRFGAERADRRQRREKFRANQDGSGGRYGCGDRPGPRGQHRYDRRGRGMPRRGGPNAERFFERCDADGDGVLTRQEFEAIHGNREHSPPPGR
jgi:Spy/CpxP family protein refolding chaperone